MADENSNPSLPAFHLSQLEDESWALENMGIATSMCEQLERVQKGEKPRAKDGGQPKKYETAILPPGALQAQAESEFTGKDAHRIFKSLDLHDPTAKWESLDNPSSEEKAEVLSEVEGANGEIRIRLTGKRETGGDILLQAEDADAPCIQLSQAEIDARVDRDMAKILGRSSPKK